MEPRTDELTGQIKALLEAKNYPELKKLLVATEPQDIALLFEELDESSLPVLIRLLPQDLAALSFSEMSPDIQETLIKRFTDAELRAILDEMYIDDTVDVIEEMPANIVKRILANSDKESREQINKILRYPEDSAGSIMTVEYVRLEKNMSVADAFSRIRRVGTEKETIYTCYVTSSDKTLVGVVTAMDLMLAEPDVLISDIMNTAIISVTTDDDKETVAQTMSKYDFLAIPVVDKNNRLVGIVTYDDAMDVIKEEATEDIEKMAAITPTDKPYLKVGVFETWLHRIPWLLVLMLSATFTGAILGKYEGALAKIIQLSVFVPMLMDTSGNAGGQASVTIIRALSLGDVVPSDVFRVLWKEIRVALLCGVSLGIVGFLKAYFIDGMHGIDAVTGTNYINVSLAVAATLCLTIIVAKTVGCLLPILIKRLGFDPAVVASPFITTIVDAISLVVYFGIATTLIPQLK